MSAREALFGSLARASVRETTRRDERARVGGGTDHQTVASKKCPFFAKYVVVKNSPAPPQNLPATKRIKVPAAIPLIPALGPPPLPRPAL